ncbi:hypothetical protein ACRDU6_27480 [Mycolicibacterium sp. ELW1]|uniref:hypothetical protein n=1 Tax=Mycobacteriaceae TaxID=1762 RepID=UPI0011F09A97|nr:hypothetical protein [Mycobacterium sp. ELW1]QEN15935.1 hypothetical protein D3H54_23990 [Mycobacterium sp. ELW1]
MTEGRWSLSVQRSGNVARVAKLKQDETNGEIHLDFQGPAAIIVKCVPEALAVPHERLALHRYDLGRARDFLNALDQQDFDPGMEAIPVVCSALWRAALTSVFKCFQRSAEREKLSPDDVFGQDVNDSRRAAFDHLQRLRDKHVAHDENNWMQSRSIAIVGKSDTDPLVESVECLVVEGDSATTENIERLRVVVDTSLAWVVREFDERTVAIEADLRSRDHEELLALPDFESIMPNDDSVGMPRRRNSAD